MQAEHIIHGEAIATSSCYIFFLARKDGNLRVFCYTEYPWVKNYSAISKDGKSKRPEPKLFILRGDINLHGTNDDNLNEPAINYSPDKI